MKKYIILLFIFLVELTVTAQPDLSCKRYKKAFSHILSDSSFKKFKNSVRSNCLNVSNETIPLTLIGNNFLDYLTKYTSYNYDSISKPFSGYLKIDESLSKFPKCNKKKHINFFFSELVNGLLIVEIRNTVNKSDKYLNTDYMGQSLSFVFLFEEDNIIESESKIMHYQ